jgi:hypothetical protein
MKLGVSEILEKVSKLKKKEERIEELRKHGDNRAMLQILQYALDPRIKWLLPEGTPPYKKNEYLDQESNLYSEVRRLYLFVEGGNPNLTPLKREMLFIGLLEMLAPADAALLCAAKDKKLPYKTITKEIVNEAFPGLLVLEEKVA